MLKKICLWGFIILVVAIGGLAGVVALQPATYHVERTTKIAAAPGDVFPHVNDFHKWEKWSPWLKIDPNAKGTYEGPESGKDAIFRWEGNSDVGKGSMTILESQPDEKIRIKLEFLEPMAGVATTDFTFKTEGEHTIVTWSMDGENNFVGKAMCLVMNMEKMIGEKYDEGLANLKRVVEAKE